MVNARYETGGGTPGHGKKRLIGEIAERKRKHTTGIKEIRNALKNDKSVHPAVGAKISQIKTTRRVSKKRPSRC